MKTTWLITLFLTLIAAVSGGAAPSPRIAPQDDIVASVNGEAITREMLVKRLLAYHGAANLEAMINQTIVRQAAEREKVTVTDKEIDDRVNDVKGKARTPALFQQWLNTSGFTEPQYREQVRYTLLTEKIATKVTPVADSDLEQVRIRVILVKTEDEGRNLIKALKQGGDFIQFAKEKSIDQESGAMGGAMPEFTKADFPDLWQALERVKPGEIPNPVKLGANYGVVKLEARIPAATLTDAQRSRLRQRLLGFRMNVWLDNVRKQAKIAHPVPLILPQGQ
jgi:foldase protein PrsA